MRSSARAVSLAVAGLLRNPKLVRETREAAAKFGGIIFDEFLSRHKVIFDDSRERSGQMGWEEL